MSYKKLSVTPLESTTANNVALKDTYLDQVSDLNPQHCFFLMKVAFWKQRQIANLGAVKLDKQHSSFKGMSPMQSTQ